MLSSLPLVISGVIHYNPTTEAKSQRKLAKTIPHSETKQENRLI